MSALSLCHRKYILVIPAIFLMAVSTFVLSGCYQDSPQRKAKLWRIAHWEDQRFAPEDSMKTMLTDTDAHVRLAAARAAGLIGRQEAVEPLVEMLPDPSVTIGSEACFSLGLLGGKRAVEALSSAVADPHQQIRLAALSGLGQAAGGGKALLAATNLTDPDLLAAAWDALRNRAKELDQTKVTAAIQGGLTNSDPNLQWRVLRCAEIVPDTSLTPVIAPLARSKFVQVRVHAFRALARQNSEDALNAILAGASSHHQFRGRDRARIDIALCRALGRLAHRAFETPTAQDPAPDAMEITDILINAAGSADPHVSETALMAMGSCVKNIPLPAEAAQRESLLPVWRIRMNRVASKALTSDHLGIRRAAVFAWSQLRGAGCSSELAQLSRQEEEPVIQAEILHAIASTHPDPLPLLLPWVQASKKQLFPGNTRPNSTSPTVRVAALESLDQVLDTRQAAMPAGLTLEMARSRIASLMRTAALDSDFVVAATAAGLLGHFHNPLTVGTLDQAWRIASGPGRFEVRRAIVKGIKGMAATHGDTLPLTSRQLCATLLQKAFDSTDLRIRLEARTAALATHFLPDNLIPSEASLRATLPPRHRHPDQAQLALPFDAPKVQCVTPHGKFTITLDGHIAPNTCAVFLDLINAGFYDDLSYHRVVPDFVIQGGDPRSDGWGGPGYTICSEWSPTPFARGVVGIAHDGKDTGGSQFFVTLSAQPHLNARYTVFGKVTSGMPVVDKIEVGDHFRLQVIP